MKRLLLAALIAAAAAGDAQAGALADLSITDLDTGAILPVYTKAGRHYVAGVPGHRYALNIQNHLSERVMTVVSVDGINAVTGQTAGAQQSGYVLAPWESAQVRGWRKSLSDVAEFVFTSVPHSYAARTGRPQNVGVIGVAIFREAVPQPPPPPVYQRDDDGWDYRAEAPAAKDSAEYAQREERAAAESAPAAPAGSLASKSAAGVGAAPRARQQLGTGHGERRYDPVGTTEFQRLSSTPSEVITIYYDDYQTLIARGVVPPPYRQHPRREPDPFPVGFVPDPRW